MKRIDRNHFALATLAALFACATPPRGAPDASASRATMIVPKPSPDSAAAQTDAEVILGSGGELDLAQLPAATVQRANGEIVAWGLAEVPGDSRLQATFALADANARAELLAAVRVGIAASTSSKATADSQEVTDRTAQVANGILPSLTPPQHGWRKFSRHGEVILRAVSRLSAREDALTSALTQAMPHAKDPGADAARVLDQLGSGHPLSAP